MAQTQLPSSPLGLVVARVFGPQGRPVGTAFLAAPDRLLTAAHVANLSLGRAAGAADRPSGSVVVDFPLLAPGQRFHAEVEHWVPPGDGHRSDIAGLRLLESPSLPVPPAPIVDDEASFDSMGTVLGFPARADDGVWSIVRLRGGQGVGWTQIDLDQVSQFPIEQGFSGAPVWDPTRGTVVGMVTHAWRGGGIQSAYMVPAAGLFEAWPGLRELARPPSPYPGLRQFTEDDAEMFFGRDDLAEQIAALAATNAIVTVTGGSGVGKSSLLAAGVMPRLRSRTDILTVRCVPGEAQTPVRALALALADACEPGADAARRLGTVDSYVHAMSVGQTAEIVTDLLRRRQRRQLVVVIDQFEQVLAAAKEQIAFFGAVLTALVSTAGRPCLMLGIRQDFIPLAGRDPYLSELITRAYQIPVPELDTAGLREAIERPLQRLQTVRFESQLVDQLIAEVEGQPGRLPLMQFALSHLWERQSEGLVTYASYRAQGDLRSMLTDYAERIWEGLTDTEQRLARRLLSQLVHPMPGNDQAFTRRTVQRLDLSDELWAVAGRLAADRLVQLSAVEHRGGQTVFAVELAHDTLILHWHRLAAIAREDREFRLWQDAIRHRAEQWFQQPGVRSASFWRQILRPQLPRRRGQARSNARLLSLGELREARHWRTRRNDLSWAEMKYLEASQTRQSVLRTRAAAVVAIAAIIPLYLVVDTNRELGEIHLRQRSQELAAQSLEAGATNGPLAQLLAAAAWEVSETDEARLAMTNAANNPNVGMLTDGHANPVTALAFSPDGSLLATGDERGTLALREWPSGEVVSLPDPFWYNVDEISFSPDGEMLVAKTLASGEVRIWDVASRELIARLEVPMGYWGGISYAFSADGTLMATGGDTLQVWDTTSFEEIKHLERFADLETPDGDPVFATALMFDRSGETIFVGDQSGAIHEWAIASDEEIRSEPLPVATLETQIVPNPAGSGEFLTCTTTCFLWDEPWGERLEIPSAGGTVSYDATGTMIGMAGIIDRSVTIRSSPDWNITGRLTAAGDVEEVAFSPDGSTVVGATPDGVQVWDLNRLPEMHAHINPRGSVRDLNFTADGSRLITAGDVGIHYWDAATLEPIESYQDDPTLIAVSISADASTAYGWPSSGGPPHSRYLYDLHSGETQETVFDFGNRFDNTTCERALNSDGSAFAASCTDDDLQDPPSLTTWDAATGSLISEFDLDGVKWTGAPVFSPDGSILAALDDTGAVRLWDTATGKLRQTLSDAIGADGLAFSDDGTMIAAGGNGVSIWDLNSGDFRRLSDGTPTDEIGIGGGTAFSPDERYLATIFGDLGVVIWDLQLGETAATIYGNMSWGDLVFAPDGRSLAISSEDLQLVDLSFLQDPYRAVCEQAGRQLTAEEWERYLNDYEPTSLEVCGT
jgi:WD40 repeat protein